MRFPSCPRGASALPDGVTRPFQGGASLFFYFLEGRVATYRCDHDLYRATANALVDLGALVSLLLPSVLVVIVVVVVVLLFV